MQEFDSIKDMVYCEIDEIARAGKLDMNTVKILGDLVDILKDIGYIESFEEGVEVYGANHYDGNSYDSGMGGYSQKRMPVYYYDERGGGYHGGRGGSGYSRRGGRMGYSREDSKGHMISKLENLMNETGDEESRQAIQNLIY